MLIVHCGHHRCGTVWFNRIFRNLCTSAGLTYLRGSQAQLAASRADIFFQDHSRIEPENLPPFRGSHIRRDPRDVLVSCYFYHLWSDEPWLKLPREKHEGRSHQEMLQASSLEDGLLIELDASAGHQIQSMIDWARTRDGFHEVRYEDLIHAPQPAFAALFRGWGLDGGLQQQAWDAVEAARFEKYAGRKIGEIGERHHLRSGRPGQWRDSLGEMHLRALEERFPGYLAVLGYG